MSDGFLNDSGFGIASHTLRSAVKSHSLSSSQQSNNNNNNLRDSRMSMSHMLDGSGTGISVIHSSGQANDRDGKLIRVSFDIPVMPRLERLSEPKPPQKTLVAGYDMRTLRRQIDNLQEEINSRLDYQVKIFHQNEELWNYVRNLFESSKHNASIMGQEILRLHDNIRVLDGERRELAEKLVLSKNSRELIRKLNEDLGDITISAAEMSRIKADAEKELKRAKVENSTLEESLKEHAMRLERLHGQLDEQRAVQREIDGLDAADDFFQTNKVVLRAAYKRFREGIQKRFRLTKIGLVFNKIYSIYLKKSCWGMWTSFLRRREVMKRNLVQRNSEILIECLMAWKVETMESKLSQSSRRKAMLRSSFACWKRFHEDILGDSEKDAKVEVFLSRSNLKNCFYTWKKSVCFLGWFSREIEVKESFALRYFTRKIFLSWKQVTDETLFQSHMLFKKVRNQLFIGRFFKEWHLSCNFKWKKRGRLLRSFYRNLRLRITKRLINAKSNQVAIKVFTSSKMRSVLRHWKSFARLRRLYGRGIHGIKKYHSFNMRKIAKSALIYMIRRVLIISGMKMKRKVADRHWNVFNVSKSFLFWHSLAKKNSDKRKNERRAILRNIFDDWLSYVSTEQRDRYIENVTETYMKDKKDRAASSCIEVWRKRAHRIITLRRLKSIVENKISRSTVSRVFYKVFLSKFNSKLLQKIKELQLDLSRSEELRCLKGAEKNSVDREVERLMREIQDVQQSCSELKSAIRDLQIEVSQKKVKLERVTGEKHLSEERAAMLSQEIIILRGERQRLKSVEKSMLSERLREKEFLNKKSRDTDAMISTMEAECDALRSEASFMSSNSKTFKEHKDDRINKSEILFSQSRDTKSSILNLSRENQSYLDELKSENKETYNEIESISRRFKEVKAEGNSIVLEKDDEIRRKTAELNALTSQTDLLDARNRALVDLSEESERQYKFESLQNTLERNDQELRDLRLESSRIISSPVLNSSYDSMSYTGFNTGVESHNGNSNRYGASSSFSVDGSSNRSSQVRPSSADKAKQATRRSDSPSAFSLFSPVSHVKRSGHNGMASPFRSHTNSPETRFRSPTFSDRSLSESVDSASSKDRIVTRIRDRLQSIKGGSATSSNDNSFDLDISMRSSGNISDSELETLEYLTQQRQATHERAHSVKALSDRISQKLAKK